jgi:hypothetical protein
MDSLIAHTKILAPRSYAKTTIQADFTKNVTFAISG